MKTPRVGSLWHILDIGSGLYLGSDRNLSNYRQVQVMLLGATDAPFGGSSRTVHLTILHTPHDIRVCIVKSHNLKLHERLLSRC